MAILLRFGWIFTIYHYRFFFKKSTLCFKKSSPLWLSWWQCEEIKTNLNNIWQKYSWQNLHQNCMQQIWDLFVEHRYFKFQSRFNFVPINNGTIESSRFGETTISATDDIGHNHIGHTKHHIGHKQNRYRPHVDIGHTISATKRVTFSYA